MTPAAVLHVEWALSPLSLNSCSNQLFLRDPEGSLLGKDIIDGANKGRPPRRALLFVGGAAS